MAPYQREPMEAVTDPTVQSVALMWASQVGKTEVMNNIVAYFIAADPAPILMVQPTIEFAESWSKERLAPMLRDTPALAGLVQDVRSRDSGNTILHKAFPGGNIAVAGANAPSGLAGRPRRVVLMDEVDRYPQSAGTEGDPCLLAERRTESFWNAVIVKTSTPTLKNASRIESEFEQTDRRMWFCPCPKCGEHQVLKWGDREAPGGVKWPKGDPAAAYYECENCLAKLTDADRLGMVKSGEWRPTAPFTGKRGYHLNGINSPFPKKRGYTSRLHQMVAGFLEAKAGGRETLKTWVNTFLAETFEDQSEKVEGAAVMERLEDYVTDGKAFDLPQSALFITAAVDVQRDRFEVEIDGWGLHEESWAIEYIVIPGDPLRPAAWTELDAVLSRTFKAEDGRIMTIAATCIDSGDGTTTDAVLSFCKPRFARRVFAIKGSNQSWAPLVAGPYRGNRRKCPVYRVGTDTAKSIIYARLKMQTPGPGYMHYPKGRQFDSQYFSGLTAEEIRVGKKKSGFPERKWHKTRDRNEPLDLRVYSLAAVAILQPNWNVMTKRLEKPSAGRKVETEDDTVEQTEKIVPARPSRRVHVRRGGWVGGWKH